MDEFQKKAGVKLIKIFILADIIEAEILEINPSVTINDTATMLSMENLKNSCKRYRIKCDTGNQEFAEKIGELSDFLDVEINKILK